MSKVEGKKNWFARHKILTVIGVLVVLGIIGSVSGGSKSTNTPNTSDSNTNSSTSQKTEATIAKIGTPAADGKFEFTVKSIECGKTSVGANQYFTKTAQGQYCLLNISVKNIGNEAQSLFSSNQKLLNASGQKYSADDVATMYASSDGIGSWYSNINPGNSVEGSIVFDIPKDQTPSTAELHDSAFSSGVNINLQ